MKKSKSEETSRLFKKDPIRTPHSTHNVPFHVDAATNTKILVNPGGDDNDLILYPALSASSFPVSRHGSATSSLITVLEKQRQSKSGFSRSSQDIGTQTLLDVPLPPPVPPLHHSVIGIGFAFTCAVALSCASFLVKYLARHKIPPSNSVFWRGPLVVLISAGWLICLCCSSSDRAYMSKVLWPPTKKGRVKIIGVLILSRVIFGPVSTITQFYSLKYIDLGDSNTIVFSAAAFVPIFAYCFLHEAWGVVPFFAALLTALGVMIISKPSFMTGVEEKPGTTRSIGFSFAIISMIFNIGLYITLRYLHHVPGAILILVSSGCSTLAGLVLTLSTGGFVLPKDFVDIAATVALMTTTAIGQYALIWSLRYEAASMVSLIRCSELVFGFLWQMIFGIFPDAFSIGGASLVLFSFGIVFFRKYLQQLPYEHRLRHYFKYLLK